MKIEVQCMCQLFDCETLDIFVFVCKQLCALECWLLSETELLAII